MQWIKATNENLPEGVVELTVSWWDNGAKLWTFRNMTANQLRDEMKFNGLGREYWFAGEDPVKLGEEFKEVLYHGGKAGGKTDFQIAWELANTRDKPFFIDELRKLIQLYDREEISLSKFCEELNVSAVKWKTKETRPVEVCVKCDGTGKLDGWQCGSCGGLGFKPLDPGKVLVKPAEPKVEFITVRGEEEAARERKHQRRLLFYSIGMMKRLHR